LSSNFFPPPNLFSETLEYLKRQNAELRSENEELKRRQQSVEREKELMQQELYIKTVSLQAENNPMRVGVPQEFELIDTQKTDPALEKYAVKVVKKAFNKVVANRVNLEIQSNRDLLLNEVTEKMEQLPRGAIVEGQTNWSVIFYRREKASASVCCKGPCLVLQSKDFRFIIYTTD